MGSDQEARPQQPSLSTQERVGPYRIERLLGRGGMGEVFRGFDERLDRPVALKRLKAQDVDAASGKRLKREARAIARVHHSAIVQVHDWVEDNSGAWIVMELVEGQSLRQRLHTGVALEVAIEWANRIAEGLAIAHRAGIVHRDLKPENVMISDDGEVKILDFGLAKRPSLQESESSLTVAGAILGTTTAMSPEQALGRTVDHRSDLFSLGTLIYEMVTGQSPFRSDVPTETLTRICTQKQVPAHQLNPAVPPGVSRLIDDLLNKDPALRPTASDVARELQGLRFEATTGAEAAMLPRRARALNPTIDEPTAADTRSSREIGREAPVSMDHPRSRIPWPAIGLGTLLVVVALMVWWRATLSKAPPGPSAAEVSLADLGEHELYMLATQLLRRYDKKDNIDRGVEVLQRLLAKNPESASGHAALALAYGYLSRTKSRDPDWLRKAEAIAERAVTLDPFLAAGRTSRGFIYRLLGRSDEALVDLEEALKLDPESIVTRLELARVHAGRADFETAEAILSEGTQRFPDAWMLHLDLGILHYRGARYEQAQADFERVVALVPDNAIGWRNLSAAHYSLGDLAKASAVLQRAIEIEPEATLYGNLGTYYFAQGLYPQALQAFERVISLAGGAHDYRMWANLADAYRWTPDHGEQATQAYERALQLLAEALEARPEDVMLKSRRALYLAKMGDCEAAQAELRTLETKPEIDGATHYRRAVAAEVCGQRQPALEALSNALQAGYATLDVKSDPELRRLREDPAYHRLMVTL